MKFPIRYPKLPGAVRLKSDGFFFCVMPCAKDRFDPRDLAKIDTFFTRGVILKNSRTSTAALAEIAEDGVSVFLKRCNNKGLRFTLRYLFRPARVFRAAQAAELLKAAGVRTPEVLLVGERRSGPILKAGYLVTSTAPDIRSVDQLLRETTVPEIFLESLLAQAAELTALLHRNRIEHGDLKIVNFYHIGRWTPKSQFGIWDLDSVRCYRNAVPRRRVERELSRIVFSTHLASLLNPVFPENLRSVRDLSERLARLYLAHLPPGLPHPDPARIEFYAEKRLAYRRKHPYEDQLGDHLS